MIVQLVQHVFLPLITLWFNSLLPVLKVEGRSSVIETFKQLLAEEGLWGMTKGLSARIISSLPTSVLIVVGYETLKRLSLRADLIESRHWWNGQRADQCPVSITPPHLPFLWSSPEAETCRSGFVWEPQVSSLCLFWSVVSMGPLWVSFNCYCLNVNIWVKTMFCWILSSALERQIVKFDVSLGASQSTGWTPFWLKR